MKTNIVILFFLAINSITAQTRSSDYFTLYKGGDKYLKPVKYLLFDSNLKDNIKREDKRLTYFQIAGEYFKFDTKNNKKDSYPIDILKKVKLQNPAELGNQGYKLFKKKKEDAEKKKNIKLVYPPAGYEAYLKIYIFEKIENNKVVRYEVHWEHLDL